MIVILGNGGHARVLEAAIRSTFALANIQCVDFQEDAPKPTDEVGWVIGVGDMKLRRMLYERFASVLANVIHDTATLYCKAGRGFQAMAGVIIQPGCKIGNNVLINTRASIDHDCIIGDHVHIAPGAILCGGVTVGEGAFIGAGAIIPEGKVVPAGAFVKAGTVYA